MIKKASYEKISSGKLLIKRKARGLQSKFKPGTYERRKSILINNIEVGKSSGLEIGPLDKPLVTREAGAIQYVDYMSRDELIARHAGTCMPENIVEVDHVISPRNYLSDVIQEKFDYVIACHVIEHIPNMIGWLNDVHQILKDNGYLYLAVPDKRYTFDIARPVTPLSHILNDFHQNVTTADFAHVFEHIYLKRNITAGDVWNNKAQSKINTERFTAHDAYRRTTHEMEPGKYPDVHCHVFTSQDFMSIIKMLIDLHLIAYAIRSFEDVKRPYNEFIIILQKTK